MKYLVTGLLILCLLVGLCWFSERQIRDRTGEIAAPLEQALAALRTGSEDSAQAHIAQAAEAWTKNEGVLASFISHDHTNGIGEDMARLPWLRGAELGSALEELIRKVRGLAEMERIVWRNIF